MARQWVKRELKRDPLISFVIGLLKFFRQKPQTAVTIGASILIVLIFSLIIYMAYEKNLSRGYSQILRAESVLRSSPDLSVSLAERIAAGMKSSRKIQSMAYMVKGDALYVKGDYKGAEEAYGKALSGIPSEFKPNLEFDLAKTKEAEGDFQQAEKLYEKFLANYDRHYLSPDAHLSLARILIAQKRVKEAAYHLDVVASRHQGTKWAEDAKKYRDRLPK